VTEFGKPFTAAGFGNWTAATRRTSSTCPRTARLTLAPKFNVGAFELMAIAGHSSLKETTRYTKRYERDKKAETGMAKLEKLQIGAPGTGMVRGEPEKGKNQ
jgi:hypothetical protein